MKKICIFFFFLLVYLLLPAVSYAATETTLYLGSVEKTLETGESKVYYSLGNTTVVRNIKADGSSTVSYLHQDHLGSTILITNDKGNIQGQSLVYYPYGKEIASPDPGSGIAMTDKLYTGQRKDTSSDLYFYNARYYNPKTSRFISADKAEGPNRYAYVANNPIMRNDPTGNVVCAGDKCKNIFGSSEGYPEIGKPFKNITGFFEWLGAQEASLLGISDFLPEHSREYLSQNQVANTRLVGALPIGMMNLSSVKSRFVGILDEAVVGGDTLAIHQISQSQGLKTYFAKEITGGFSKGHLGNEIPGSKIGGIISKSERIVGLSYSGPGKNAAIYAHEVGHDLSPVTYYDLFTHFRQQGFTKQAASQLAVARGEANAWIEAGKLIKTRIGIENLSPYNRLVLEQESRDASLNFQRLLQKFK